MARFPCSRCKKVYRGPQQTAYPALVTAGATYQERLRLCPDCFHLVVNDAVWSLADADDLRKLPCGICGAVDTPVAIFCTYYENHQERKDLYGRLCAGPCPTEFLVRVWGTVERGYDALRVIVAT